MSASWEISELPGWIEIRADDGRLVAEVFDEDDARLIKAAPKLLAALKKLAEYGNNFRWDPKFETNPYEKAVDAIAEAEPKKALV